MSVPWRDEVDQGVCGLSSGRNWHYPTLVGGLGLVLWYTGCVKGCITRQMLVKDNNYKHLVLLHWWTGYSLLILRPGIFKIWWHTRESSCQWIFLISTTVFCSQWTTTDPCLPRRPSKTQVYQLRLYGLIALPKTQYMKLFCILSKVKVSVPQSCGDPSRQALLIF